MLRDRDEMEAKLQELAKLRDEALRRGEELEKQGKLAQNQTEVLREKYSQLQRQSER